jgi:hypothetical protein
MWLGRTVRVGEVEVLGSVGFFGRSELESRTVRDPDGQYVIPVRTVHEKRFVSVGSVC